MLAEAEPDDDALVTLARAGDRVAFARLVERHYDFIHRVAWRWSADRADAEDIAQEVCIRLGRAIAGFRGEGRFTTWLYQLTLNAARDLARKTVRETRKAEAFASEPIFAGDGGEDHAAEELWDAVCGLPDKQREAVLLVHSEGLSHAGAAEIMGCAEPTVSWHIHQAKKRLRVMLRAAGEG